MYKLTRLQELRREVGLSQSELADLSGVPKGTIQKHERGAYDDVSLSVAHKLATALAVPIESLFLPEITSTVLKETA